MHVVEFEQVQFKLPNPVNSSQYVGITDGVEKAWLDISSRRPFSSETHATTDRPQVPDQLVSMEDFPKLGKPADSLKVTNSKTGETGYRVGLGVFHQLRCLNLLRMSTYPEYYQALWGSETHDSPELVREQLGMVIALGLASKRR